MKNSLNFVVTGCSIKDYLEDHKKYLLKSTKHGIRINKKCFWTSLDRFFSKIFLTKSYDIKLIKKKFLAARNLDDDTQKLAKKVAKIGEKKISSQGSLPSTTATDNTTISSNKKLLKKPSATQVPVLSQLYRNDGSLHCGYHALKNTIIAHAIYYQVSEVNQSLYNDSNIADKFINCLTEMNAKRQNLGLEEGDLIETIEKLKSNSRSLPNWVSGNVLENISTFDFTEKSDFNTIVFSNFTSLAQLANKNKPWIQTFIICYPVTEFLYHWVTLTAVKDSDCINWQVTDSFNNNNSYILDKIKPALLDFLTKDRSIEDWKKIYYTQSTHRRIKRCADSDENIFKARVVWEWLISHFNYIEAVNGLNSELFGNEINDISKLLRKFISLNDPVYSELAKNMLAKIDI